MDMFLLFVVVFFCVIIGVGLSALALSLLFRLFLKLSGTRATGSLGVPAPATTQAPPAV